jgi:hypothetical protein
MDGMKYFLELGARRPQPYARGQNGKFACPCCQYFTLFEFHQYQICPVCFWEDDGAVNAEDYGGPNHMTLGQGRENYHRIGCCQERMLQRCRPPHEDEKLPVPPAQNGNAEPDDPI